MARKTANDDSKSPSPPTQAIHMPDRKRKRNTSKEIHAEIQPNLKRKQIPYQTSTQTLKVGRYPPHKKGSNETVDTNVAKQLRKPVGATKAHKKKLPAENNSDDDFVANTMSAKSQGNAKLQTAAESVDIKGLKPKQTEKGKKGIKEKDGHSTRYKGFETRTTPNTLTDVVRSLTEQQKIAVGSMGLDGMLNLGITCGLAIEGVKQDGQLYALRDIYMNLIIRSQQ
ncbi:hypothetical protein QQ045_017445 [Rhodiola kirilowii]